jgi:hypothetical protein
MLKILAAIADQRRIDAGVQVLDEQRETTLRLEEPALHPESSRGTSVSTVTELVSLSGLQQ